MALVQCTDCGASVSSRSKKCIHCGAKIKKKPWEVALGLVTLAAMIAGVAKCVASIPAPPPETAFDRERRVCSDKDPAAQAAYRMSKEFVVERLRAPSTATFPSYGAKGVHVRHSFGCSFEVSGFVDAQNAFGAMIRTTFKVYLQYLVDEDKWRAISIAIGDT